VRPAQYTKPGPSLCSRAASVSVVVLATQQCAVGACAAAVGRCLASFEVITKCLCVCCRPSRVLTAIWGMCLPAQQSGLLQGVRRCQTKKQLHGCWTLPEAARWRSWLQEAYQPELKGVHAKLRPQVPGCLLKASGIQLRNGGSAFVLSGVCVCAEQGDVALSCLVLCLLQGWAF
jgi:hypothetical protein